MISYSTEMEIDVDSMIDVYRDSGLGERRPVDDRERMSGMLADANLLVTAWDGERLVGVSRCITDWVYCNYLSDLAVRLEYQNHGIGKELVRLSREATPQATLILLAAPKAVDYYPRIGMTRHDSAWILRPGESVT